EARLESRSAGGGIDAGSGDGAGGEERLVTASAYRDLGHREQRRRERGPLRQTAPVRIEGEPAHPHGSRAGGHLRWLVGEPAPRNSLPFGDGVPEAVWPARS